MDFEWESDPNSDSSRFQISLSENFNSFVKDTVLTKNQFSINNLQITSRSIKAKNFVSFLRSLKNDPKLFFLEMIIKDGYLEGNIDLNFNKKGKLENDYKNFEFELIIYFSFKTRYYNENKKRREQLLKEEKSPLIGLLIARFSTSATRVSIERSKFCKK